MTLCTDLNEHFAQYAKATNLFYSLVSVDVNNNIVFNINHYIKMESL